MAGSPSRYDIERKQFWTSSCHLVLGQSGTGKTTFLTRALENPTRYFGLQPGVGALKLYVFCGASFDLQPRLEKTLDRSVFSEVHFPSESVGECSSLAGDLAASKGECAFCVVVDDYITQSTKDMTFLRELCFKHRRHSRVALIVAMHDLRRDIRGASRMLANHASRVYICKSPRNGMNLRSFVEPRGVGDALRTRLVRALSSAPGAYGAMFFDAASNLMVCDYDGLAAEEVVEAYGECPVSFRSERPLSSRFQISAPATR